MDCDLPHEHIHASASTRVEGYVRFVEKHKGEFSRRPQVLSAHYQMIARWCYVANAMSDVRIYVARALWANPRNWKLYAWLVSSYLGNLPFRAALKFLRN